MLFGGGALTAEEKGTEDCSLSGRWFSMPPFLKKEAVIDEVMEDLILCRRPLIPFVVDQ